MSTHQVWSPAPPSRTSASRSNAGRLGNFAKVGSGPCTPLLDVGGGCGVIIMSVGTCGGYRRGVGPELELWGGYGPHATLRSLCNVVGWCRCLQGDKPLTAYEAYYYDIYQHFYSHLGSKQRCANFSPATCRVERRRFVPGLLRTTSWAPFEMPSAVCRHVLVSTHGVWSRRGGNNPELWKLTSVPQRARV